MSLVEPTLMGLLYGRFRSAGHAPVDRISGQRQGTHPATGRAWGRLLGIASQNSRTRDSYGSASTYSGRCQYVNVLLGMSLVQTALMGSMAVSASQGTHPSTGWLLPCGFDRSRVFFLDSLTSPGRQFVRPAHLTVPFSLCSRRRGNPTDRSITLFWHTYPRGGHRGG